MSKDTKVFVNSEISKLLASLVKQKAKISSYQHEQILKGIQISFKAAKQVLYETYPDKWAWEQGLALLVDSCKLIHLSCSQNKWILGTYSYQYRG